MSGTGLRFGSLRPSMARHSEIGVSECNFPNHSLKVNSVDKSNSTKRSTKYKDLTGRVFGRLTATQRVEGLKPAWWLCLCTCGEIKAIRGNSLSMGTIKSCGCLRVDANKEGNHVTHGMSHTPEYSVWAGMWRRCTNKADLSYPRYRGYTPPAAWKSFENFYSDMGPRPSPEHSIDRVNGRLPYGPGNCRWATKREQSTNRSNTIWVTPVGLNTPMTLTEACRSGNLKYATVVNRVQKLGWGVLEATSGIFQKATAPEGGRGMGEQS